jgi:hypothetical protein
MRELQFEKGLQIPHSRLVEKIGRSRNTSHSR